MVAYRSGLAVAQLRRAGEVDADTDDDLGLHHLEQDPGYLAAFQENVIGPFELDAGLATERVINRIGHCQSGYEAK